MFTKRSLWKRRIGDVAGLALALGVLALAVGGVRADTTYVDICGKTVPVVVPASYDPAAPMPLLVGFPWYGGDGGVMEGHLHFTPLAEEYGFLYAYPDLDYPADEREMDFSHVVCLLDAIRARYAVDPRRIFLWGASSGGPPVHVMACQHADMIAAVVAVCSDPTFENHVDCSPAGPVHVLVHHGTQDKENPYGGGGGFLGAAETAKLWATYNGCGLRPDTSAPPMDLYSHLPGNETIVTRYGAGCEAGGYAELWTSVGAGHSLVDSSPDLSRFYVKWLLAHPKPFDCNGNGRPDEHDIADGTSHDCNGNLIPDECERDCNGNGIADRCDIASGAAQDCNGDVIPDECERISILFVDADAQGMCNGRSWADAVTDLQDALFLAAPGCGAAQEIWVAAGTYRTPASAVMNLPRAGTFQLASGVALYGGFAGGETDRRQRDPTANITILSGEFYASGKRYNSYHVVTASGVDATAVLDGFVITAGNANAASGSNSMGGGVYNAGGSPTIVNCMFRGNGGRTGAGFYSSAGSPTLINCTFSGNAATTSGGALCHAGGSLTLLNCTLAGNAATTSGGGAYATGTGLSLTNGILWGNTGGGATVESKQITVGTPAVGFSCIEGLSVLAGNGNIGDDPLFARNPSPGPDGKWGTADDDYGDLHLQAGSPCLNAGDPSGDYAGQTDMDGDPRVAYGRVDIGSDEFVYRGPIDFDRDMDVDLVDFAFFRACFDGPNRPWPNVGICGQADLNNDGDVDLADFGVFAACFNGPNRPPACE